MTIDSKSLGESRMLNLIQLGNFASGCQRIAMYCTDGQAVDAFCARIVSDPPSIPILIVGVESNPSSRDYDYVRGYDPLQYTAHKSFWFDEMIGKVTEQYDLSGAECLSGLAGYSNGATFAHSIIVEHPEKFDFGILFSAADNRIRPEEYRLDQDLKFYLSAGTDEPDFHRTTKQIANDLETSGINHQFAERSASHNMSFWSSELPAALQWIIGE